MFHVVMTKYFRKCLSDLKNAGGQRQRPAMAAKAAAAEARMDGKITSLHLTRHGESRLQNIEKYDLGSGCRLIVQLIDKEKNSRAFLFAGDHDDAEQWIENNKNYQWVRKESDNTLEFVEITPTASTSTSPPNLDFVSIEAVKSLPVLRNIDEKAWGLLSLSASVSEYIRAVTTEAWEQDYMGVLENIQIKSDLDIANLSYDLLSAASRNDLNAVYARIALVAGKATIPSGAELAESMLSIENSERFVTWEEVETLPPDFDWADWMLFLHPEQKKLAIQEFNGPARLRGVSGSGKTCVMLHRAKFLALKYKQPILLITLTNSTVLLLNQLLDRLCHTERNLIHVSNIASAAKDLIIGSDKAMYSEAPRYLLDSLRQSSFDFITKHPSFPDSPLRALSPEEVSRFVLDEILYVRSRLVPGDYSRYLSSDFKRRGRKIPLSEVFRRMFLEAIQAWDRRLDESEVFDPESLMAMAAQVVSGDGDYRFRSLLIDEVQDLSEVELTFLSMIRSPDGDQVRDIENGLFLVGDGAQTIYKKGFSLKSIGLSVSGRSYALQKNYRNTREILDAAFSLIERFEFADVDEDNIATPIPPHYASRLGEKPFLVKCTSFIDEAILVARIVSDCINAGTIPGQICIIGFEKATRNDMQNTLSRIGIDSIELRQDADFESPRVKISTVESAKGHEFDTVILVDLNQGIIPAAHLGKEEWPREVARLYVAMTRAKNELYMSYVLGGGCRPSELLLGISDKCQELEFRDDEFKRHH